MTVNMDVQQAPQRRSVIFQVKKSRVQPVQPTEEHNDRQPPANQQQQHNAGSGSLVYRSGSVIAGNLDNNIIPTDHPGDRLPTQQPVILSPLAVNPGLNEQPSPAMHDQMVNRSSPVMDLNRSSHHHPDNSVIRSPSILDHSDAVIRTSQFIDQPELAVIRHPTLMDQSVIRASRSQLQQVQQPAVIRTSPTLGLMEEPTPVIIRSSPLPVNDQISPMLFGGCSPLIGGRREESMETSTTTELSVIQSPFTSIHHQDEEEKTEDSHALEDIGIGGQEDIGSDNLILKILSVTDLNRQTNHKDSELMDISQSHPLQVPFLPDTEVDIKQPPLLEDIKHELVTEDHHQGSSFSSSYLSPPLTPAASRGSSVITSSFGQVPSTDQLLTSSLSTVLSTVLSTDQLMSTGFSMVPSTEQLITCTPSPEMESSGDLESEGVIRVGLRILAPTENGFMETHQTQEEDEEELEEEILEGEMEEEEGEELQQTEKTKNNKSKPKVERKKTTVECAVCGDTAINHMHYGGLCCYSCKAFFRRAVTSKHQEKTKRCRGTNGKCKFSVNRKSCPHCRYKRCEEIGMKRSLVLSGKQEALKHTGRFKKSASLNTGTAFSLTKKYTAKESGVPRKGKFQGSPDMLEVAQLVHKFNVAKKWIFSSWIEENFDKNQDWKPPEVVFACQEVLVKLIVLFVKHINEVRRLDWASQARLLRRNVADILILVVVTLYDKDSDSFRLEVDIGNETQFIYVDDKTVSKRAGEGISKELFKISSLFTEYSLTLEAYLLLICIILFTRGEMQMEKQTKADLSLTHYNRLLSKYLAASHTGKKLSNSTIQKLLTEVSAAALRLRGLVLTDL